MIPLSQLRSSIDCSTTLSSSRSRARATAFGPTLISFLSTSAPTPSSSHRSYLRRTSAAADHPRVEVPITQTADHQPRQVRKITRPKVRRFRGPLTRLGDWPNSCARMMALSSRRLHQRSRDQKGQGKGGGRPVIGPDDVERARKAAAMRKRRARLKAQASATSAPEPAPEPAIGEWVVDSAGVKTRLHASEPSNPISKKEMQRRREEVQRRRGNADATA